MKRIVKPYGSLFGSYPSLMTKNVFPPFIDQSCVPSFDGQWWLPTFGHRKKGTRH